MKKIITGSLLTAIISNNIAYANNINNTIDYNDNINNEILNKSEDTIINKEQEENLDNNYSIDNPFSNEDQNININKDKDNKSTSISQINVDNYDSLKEALSKSDVEINIKNNIQIIDTINVTGSNILINGEGYTLDLNEIDPLSKKNKFIH